MAYDPIAFETTLTDIETHLGYLRGNEAAWQYLEDVASSVDLNGGEGGVTTALYLDPGYKFPCPDGQYAVTPYNGGWSMAVFVPEGATFDRDSYVKEVQANASLAYENGQAWAAGVAGYLRSVCDQFTRPDVQVLADEIRAMQQDVVDALVLNQTNDDWADLGGLEGRWTGDSAVAFSNFYQNYNDVQARHGRYLYQVNMGFAMATKLINGVQLGAQTFLEEMLEKVQEQLRSWASLDSKPGDGSPILPPWVGDVATLTGDILGLAEYVPVVGDAAAIINDLTSKSGKVLEVIRDVEAVSGKDILPDKGKSIPLATAEEVYTGLTDTLYDDYLKAFQDGMDRLDAGDTSGLPDASALPEGAFSGQSLLSSMKDAQGQGDWTLPEVGSGSLRGEGDDY